jgi:hypothetical protein
MRPRGGEVAIYEVGSRTTAIVSIQASGFHEPSHALFTDADAFGLQSSVHARRAAWTRGDP